MGIGAGTAALIVGGISLTASAVGGAKEKKSQEEAIEEAEKQAAEDLAAAQAKDEALRLQAAEDAKQAKGGVEYGIDSGTVGSYNDFLSPTASAPKSKSSFGGATTSGLGFA